jgi:hypothetical protein
MNVKKEDGYISDNRVAWSMTSVIFLHVAAG